LHGTDRPAKRRAEPYERCLFPKESDWRQLGTDQSSFLSGEREGVFILPQEDAGRLLTVGMPVHNAMPYLPEAVESLLGQTMTQFRVLAILDGSTDGSLDYLRSVALRDQRVRIVEQPHKGITSTLNRMLRECETPWLVRHDADDVSAPIRLAEICRTIGDHPDAGMFYSQAAYYPARKSVGLYRCTRGTPEQIRSIARSGYVPAICHPSTVLNVEKTLALGGYRAGLHCEDADLWWRMALAHDIHFIPQVLLYFRQSPGSLTSNNLKQQALHGLYVQYLLLSALEGRPASALGTVEKELDSMLDPNPLRAKEELRLFNIQLGQGNLLRALGRLAASARSSPSYFISRLRDEWFPPASIANGLPPALYWQRKDALWPHHLSI
jgi:glycosyltransferase involved in cell wall biosynthesis